MLKLLIPLLLLNADAKVTEKDTLRGKLIQVVDAGNTNCGRETLVVIQTPKVFRFIYSYGLGKYDYYSHFINKMVKVTYNESAGSLIDCSSGIITIKEVL